MGKNLKGKEIGKRNAAQGAAKTAGAREHEDNHGQVRSCDGRVHGKCHSAVRERRKWYINGTKSLERGPKTPENKEM